MTEDKDIQATIKELTGLIDSGQAEWHHYVKRAECFELEDMLAEAVADLEGAVRLEPAAKTTEGEPVYANMVFWYLELEEVEKASDAIARGLAQFPNSHELYSVAADLALESGDLTEALEWIEKALELAPREPSYYSQVARIYDKSGGGEKVLEAIAKAVMYEEGVMDAWYRRNELHLMAKYAPERLTFNHVLLQTIAQSDDPDPTEKALKTAWYLVGKNPLAANSLAEGIHKQYPGTHHGDWILGVGAEKVHDYGSARDHFEKILGSNPNYISVYGATIFQLLAFAYQRLGDTENRYRILKMGFEHDPENREVGADLITGAYFSGHKEESLTIGKSLAGKHLDHQNIQLNYAYVLSWSGNHDGGLEVIDRYFEIAENKEEVHQARAEILQDARRYQEAVYFFRKAILPDGSNADDIQEMIAEADKERARYEGY